MAQDVWYESLNGIIFDIFIAFYQNRDGINNPPEPLLDSWDHHIYSVFSTSGCPPPTRANKAGVVDILSLYNSEPNKL